MADNALKIPKKLAPVTLWVHPDGQVMGSIFLHMPTQEAPAGEQPAAVLNEPGDFLAVKCEDPAEVRFYNKSAIVRVSYWDAAGSGPEHGHPQPCTLALMDGALFDGVICKAEPAERSRLYDYMNDAGERFLELRSARGNDVTLINKSYVVSIRGAEEAATPPAATGSGPGNPLALNP